jgi:hypothetical protein
VIDLDELVAPPARPGFREDVFRRADAQLRTAARRRRLALRPASGVAAVAASAAGVRALEAGGAPTLIDRTISCPVPIQGGVPVFHVVAGARSVLRTQSGSLLPVAAQLSVLVENQSSVAQSTYLEGVTSAKNGYSPVEPSCRAVHDAVPLVPAGLPKDAVYRRNQTRLEGRCLSGGRITIHLRAQLEGGAPYAAKLAVRTGKRLRPLVFVDWTPDKVTTWLSPDCSS